MSARRPSGAEGRWRSLIAEQERSGEGVAEFAVRRGLNAATLYWWRSRLGRRARREPKIVPVEIVGTGGLATAAGAACFEVELSGGRRLRVPPQFDAGELRRLIAVLDNAC